MELTKTDNGKWKPGQSGNINGRPVGSHRLMRKEIRLVVRLIVVPRCGLISRRRLRLGDFSCPIAISLQADMVSAGYKYNSAGQLLIESKQDMRRRGVPSPDEADAVALCFSGPDGAAFPRDKNFHRDLRDRYEGLYI